MSIGDVVACTTAALIIVGSLFCFLAALGLLRLPDLYTRLHAASKAGVVGAGLILLGLAVASLDPAVVLRALLGIAFLLLTTPVSAHLLARAAFRSGLQPDKLTSINDLAAANSSRDESLDVVD